MTTLGDNFVKLVGKVCRKRVTTYDNGGTLYKCSLAVPTPPGYDKYQYINVGVWGDKAEALAEYPDGTWLKVTGHLEKHSFNSECKFCKGPSTVYWTDVVIDNYIILGENND